MNLGNLIDNAVKEMVRQEEKEEDEDNDDDELTLEDLDNIKNQEIEDADFEDYSEFLDGEQLSDEELIKRGIEK